MIEFSGFSPKALEFLKELKEKNNKKWYAVHKAESSKIKKLLTALPLVLFFLSRCSVGTVVNTALSLPGAISVGVTAGSALICWSGSKALIADKNDADMTVATEDSESL